MKNASLKMLDERPATLFLLPLWSVLAHPASPHPTSAPSHRVQRESFVCSTSKSFLILISLAGGRPGSVAILAQASSCGSLNLARHRRRPTVSGSCDGNFVRHDEIDKTITSMFEAFDIFVRAHCFRHLWRAPCMCGVFACATTPVKSRRSTLRRTLCGSSQSFASCRLATQVGALRRGMACRKTYHECERKPIV